MFKSVLIATAASVLLATAAPATAPQFDTPAKYAYLVDVSSGATLYAKNADARMPPASMAKMMTTDVAFELIDSGKLPLNKMCTVRPETWQKWHGPAAGSTMFLSANEQVSVENLLKGIVTLSGNDASVVLAECIAGTEQAFEGDAAIEQGTQALLREPFDCQALPNDGVGSGLEECEGDRPDGSPGGGGGGGGGPTDWGRCYDECRGDHCLDYRGWVRWACEAGCAVLCSGDPNGGDAT